jgi:nitrogen PTS system EIIA component
MESATEPLEEPAVQAASVAGPDLHALARQFDFVLPEAVLPDLQVHEPHEAIRTLLGSLVEAGAVAEGTQDDVLAAILDREALSPTAVGRGVAIPHARHAAVTRLVGAIAYCRTGIVFDDSDEGMVHLIFLLVSPLGHVEQHLRAMQSVAKHLLNGDSRAWCPPPRAED